MLVNVTRRGRGVAPLDRLPPVPGDGHWPCAACGASTDFRDGAPPICPACSAGRALPEAADD